MSKHNFYVAISKENRDVGIASVVGMFKKDITDFYKEYAGHEIRLCDGAEMKRLMMALPPQERGQPDTEGEAA